MKASILIQIGTNLSNDLSDFLKGTDTKDRLGPIRAAQSGLLTINQLKLGIMISFGFSTFFLCMILLLKNNRASTIGLLVCLIVFLYFYRTSVGIKIYLLLY